MHMQRQNPMNAVKEPLASDRDDREAAHIDDEVVELSLLVSIKQLKALQRAAERRGVSAGQLLRQVVGDYLRRRG